MPRVKLLEAMLEALSRLIPGFSLMCFSISDSNALFIASDLRILALVVFPSAIAEPNIQAGYDPSLDHCCSTLGSTTVLLFFCFLVLAWAGPASMMP